MVTLAENINQTEVEEPTSRRRSSRIAQIEVVKKDEKQEIGDDEDEYEERSAQKRKRRSTRAKSPKRAIKDEPLDSGDEQDSAMRVKAAPKRALNDDDIPVLTAVGPSKKSKKEETLPFILGLALEKEVVTVNVGPSTSDQENPEVPSDNPITGRKRALTSMKKGLEALRQWNEGRIQYLKDMIERSETDGGPIFPRAISEMKKPKPTPRPKAKPASYKVQAKAPPANIRQALEGEDTVENAIMDVIQKNSGTSMDRPMWTYINMIHIALIGNKNDYMTTQDIWIFMWEHFPYYTSASDKTWKANVRVNLNRSKTLEKNNAGGYRMKMEGLKDILFNMKIQILTYTEGVKDPDVLTSMVNSFEQEMFPSGEMVKQEIPEY